MDLPNDSRLPLTNTVYAIVRGRVQGVGYRYFALNAALEAGVTGWVRNTPTGEVETKASGTKSQLEQWLNELQKGPLLSRVTDVQVKWLTSSEIFASFDVVD